MPSYDYRCESCSKEWAENHGFNEDPAPCPFCQNKEVKKLYNYVSTVSRVEETSENKPQKKVGAKTREFIEQTRQDLKDYKRESKK